MSTATLPGPVQQAEAQPEGLSAVVWCADSINLRDAALSVAFRAYGGNANGPASKFYGDAKGLLRDALTQGLARHQSDELLGRMRGAVATLNAAITHVHELQREVLTLESAANEAGAVGGAAATRINVLKAELKEAHAQMEEARRVEGELRGVGTQRFYSLLEHATGTGTTLEQERRAVLDQIAEAIAPMLTKLATLARAEALIRLRSETEQLARELLQFPQVIDAPPPPAAPAPRFGM